MVDVSARARRRATLARVGELAPGGPPEVLAGDEWFGTAAHRHLAARPVADRHEPAVGRAARMRLLQRPDAVGFGTDPGVEPRDDTPTGRIPVVSFDDLTGPTPRVVAGPAVAEPAVVHDPWTESFATVPAAPTLPAAPTAPAPAAQPDGASQPRDPGA
ncbi:MAG: hypothetical protein L0H64_24315, partial [Pseudonocardia sp.]|nr:hypothetical protein [Pseudonocardia sp.]